MAPALAGIGAAGLVLKAARNSDEVKVMIGPTARAVAEEVHTPHPPAADAKAGKRTQPITTALRDALRYRQEQADDKDGWLFPSLKPTPSTRTAGRWGRRSSEW